MVRQYAQIIGVIVLILGVVGLFIDKPLLGLVNVDLVEDIVHLATGAILAYAGFVLKDSAATKNVVMVLGVVYLLVGVLGFITPMLFGLLQNNYSLADNVVHLVLGALGIWVASSTTTETMTTTSPES